MNREATKLPIAASTRNQKICTTVSKKASRSPLKVNSGLPVCAVMGVTISHSKPAGIGFSCDNLSLGQLLSPHDCRAALRAAVGRGAKTVAANRAQATLPTLAAYVN